MGRLILAKIVNKKTNLKYRHSSWSLEVKRLATVIDTVMTDSNDDSVRRRLMFKVILIGEISVGKTSVMRRFVHKSFANDTKGTIGADFMVKEMRLDEQILTLQIWDTAGGERFQSLGRAFYRGADCCVIVFDCSRRNTFEKLADYKEEFEKQSLDLAPNFPYAVVRNKSDLQDDVVSEEQTRNAVKRAFGEHCATFSTSAKTGEGVEDLFKWITEAVNGTVQDEDQSVHIEDRIQLTQTEPPSEEKNISKCCAKS